MENSLKALNGKNNMAKVQNNKNFNVKSNLNEAAEANEEENNMNDYPLNNGESNAGSYNSAGAAEAYWEGQAGSPGFGGYYGYPPATPPPLSLSPASSAGSFGGRRRRRRGSKKSKRSTKRRHAAKRSTKRRRAAKRSTKRRH